MGAGQFLRAGVAVVAISVLGACGGGDEVAAEPPLADTPATLKADQATADALARSTAEVGRRSLRLVRESEALDEIERLTRDLLPDIFGSSGAGNELNIDCRRNPFQFAPFLCYGELEFEANQRDNNGTVVATTVFNLQFDNFQVLSPTFDRLRVSGGVRLDYLTDFTASPRRGTIRYQSGGLSTNKDGEILAATDGALTVQTGDGSTIIETDHERLIDLSAESSSDTDGNLRSGSARANFQQGYLDFSWGGWPLVGGVPQSGATVTVAGAAGTSATITVLDAGTQGVSYELVMRDAGVDTRFEVLIPN